MNLLEACCNCPELWDEIMSSIHQTIIVVDLDGRVLFASPLVSNLLGYAPEEITGELFSIILTPEDLNCFYPNLLFLARTGRTFEGEVMLRRKHGERFIAHLVLRSRFSPREGREIILACLQDIDQQKRIEKAFKDNQYEALVKVANGIAHEIRNPLVGIGGFINRLFKSCEEAHVHRGYYDQIIKNLHKIENLVKKVEYFACLPKPTFGEVRLAELVSEAMKVYMARLEERGIRLHMRIDDAILPVDRDLMTRAVSILVENSLDALKRGGRISITSDPEGEGYQLSVIDNGGGISPADLPFIFNPFFSTKPEGAGIDLAIVKRIMEMHSGEVRVESQQGEGATFTLLFPMERRRAIRVTRFENGKEGGVNRGVTGG